MSKIWNPCIENGLIAVDCFYYRGGTSKGPVFLAADLPSARTLRNRFLLAALDSAHPRQVDGIGGFETLSNKVVIVSASDEKDIDVDYHFIQLVPTSDIVHDEEGSCGNMMSTVGPFAIETGLVSPRGEVTDVTIRAKDSAYRVTARVQTPDRKLTYHGNTQISGVSGSAAAVELTYHAPFGKTLGKLLPTGKPLDTIDGVAITLIDSGFPAMIFSAESVGKTGYESKAELDIDKAFIAKIERLRQAAGRSAGLSNTAESALPKPIMVAAPRNGGSISSRDLATRDFLPHHCHAAHSGSGAISLATACALDGTVAHSMMPDAEMAPSTTASMPVSIEHPSGEMMITVETSTSGGKTLPVRLTVVRTCRKLFKGTIYAPRSVLD